MYTVYFHRNKINNKIYVGSTRLTLSDRWRSHGQGHRKQFLLYAEITKYGWENFEHTIVAANLSKEEAHRLEGETITRLNSADPEYGYNKTYSGQGRLVPNDEFRAALSGKGNPMYGKKHAAESLTKMSQCKAGENHPMYGRTGDKNPKYGKASPMKGKRRSAETIAKMSQNRIGKCCGENHPCWGKPLSRTTKDKISAARMGRYKGAENPKARSVVNMTTHEIFGSISDATRHYGMAGGHISNCCKGKRRSAGKHPESGVKMQWMYYDADATSMKPQQYISMRGNYEHLNPIETGLSQLFSS